MNKELKVGDVIKILNFPLDINLPNQTITRIERNHFWSEHFSGMDLSITEYEIIFVS